jgi:hypothetical protein
MESALASIEGLSGDSAYMADLDDEIQATGHAYVATAVTEIASLRAQLWGSPTSATGSISPAASSSARRSSSSRWL